MAGAVSDPLKPSFAPARSAAIEFITDAHRAFHCPFLSAFGLDSGLHESISSQNEYPQRINKEREKRKREEGCQQKERMSLGLLGG